MTIYLVDVHHVMHTCPAEAEPPPYATRHTIVAITPARACITPVTIRIGDTTATIACGQHEPHHRQCPNCRNIVTYRNITTSAGVDVHRSTPITAPHLLALTAGIDQTVTA